MNNRIVTALLVAATLGTTPLAAQDSPEVELVPAFPNQKQFSRPLYIEYGKHDPEHCYVVEQTGAIWRVPRDPDEDSRQLFVDLADVALQPRNGGHNEEGLLGFAFDPDFAKNRFAYVYYSEKTGEEKYKDRRGRQRTRLFRRSVLSRMKVSKKNVLKPKSELRIMEIEQPWGNHNGGTIVFGPDRMLYVALGDGGARADRGKNGQNLETLLGSVLRIDVSESSKSKPYAIPKDNPFVEDKAARDEIFAYGLRNPWRISFDRETGDLWCGDVGQDKFEEVDRLVSGGNYGWPVREALHEFPPKRDDKDDPRDQFVDPVAEYPRTQGISITGGYVYRGTAIPGLQGCYVYGDFATSRMWAVREDRDGGEHEVLELGRARGGGIASFGEMPDGELLVLCYKGNKGRIYKMIPAGV